MAFRFNLGDDVILITSGERGQVVGRAEYEAHENCYLVRYKDALGSQCERWWDESALSSA